jgi:large subunit ribosomal protein L25
MGASYYKLDIENSKKASKIIRKAGKVPSVLYYKGEQPMSISIDEQVLYKAMKSDQRIYEVDINSESQYVMIKEIQYHPVTDHVIHVDFMRVRRSEKITISVPLTLVGKPIGVTEGGILSQAMNQIEISCYPTNVPDHLEVNIDHLGLNASISVADVNIDDEEIEIISAIDLNVASVIPPAAEEEVIISDDEESEEDAIDEESTEGTDEKTDDGENNSESTENQSKESN